MYDATLSPGPPNNITEKRNEYCEVEQVEREIINESKWGKGTVLIVGDSMLNAVDENRISANKNSIVRVRAFPEASIEDMEDYIKPLLRKEPDIIVLHIGTNNATCDTSRTILDKILTFKNDIEKKLPSSKVLISNIVKRCNGKASLTIKNFNEHLKELAIDVIDNDNITGDCLGRKGLHLNKKGNGRLALNFIHKIRTISKD